MPTGAHRQNVLFFNKAVLDSAGVSAPAAGYTTKAFLADLEKLKAKGATPLCMGGKDAFTTGELFENILLGTAGPRREGRSRTTNSARRAKAAFAGLDKSCPMPIASDSQPVLGPRRRASIAKGEWLLTMNDSATARSSRPVAPTPRSAKSPTRHRWQLSRGRRSAAGTTAPNAKNALAFPRSPIRQPRGSAIKGSVPVPKTVDVASWPALMGNRRRKALWEQ